MFVNSQIVQSSHKLTPSFCAKCRPVARARTARKRDSRESPKYFHYVVDIVRAFSPLFAVAKFVIK